MRLKIKQIIIFYRTIIENIVSLFSIRIFEYALSIITLPYLVRTLGVEKFGIIAFTQGIIQYFVLFTDYGFNLIGPKNIAQCHSDLERGKIFSAVFSSKLLLLVLSTGIFFLLITFFNHFQEKRTLYMCVYLMVLGNVISPIWFFQGIQKMRYITLANLVARVIAVCGIFSLVKREEDYIIAAFIQSVVPILAGIFSLWILVRNYRYVFVCPTVQDVFTVLREGLVVFLSTISINLYTASNIVFLGILSNHTVVGYFSAVQKIIGCVTGLLAPISQAIYPYVSQLAEQSKEQALKFVRKYMLILCAANLLIGIVLCIGSPLIVKLLLGEYYESSIPLLRLMAWLPFIISFSNVFAMQIMLPFHMQDDLSRIVAIVALFNTCVIIPTAYFWQAEGVAVTMLCTETLMSLITGYWVTKKGFNVFVKK